MVQGFHVSTGDIKPVSLLKTIPVCHVHAEVIEGIAPEELEKVLTGRKLLQACRKGKQMWMELDGGAPALMFHFGVWCPKELFHA